MENSIREFTRSVISTTSSYYQDQPMNLSVKKQKILVTSDQLENIKIEAENAMPTTENLALETTHPMVIIPIATLQLPAFKNSLQMMKSMILMPHQLDKESPLSDDFLEMAVDESAQIINVNNVPHEKDSDKENITPKTSKTPKTKRLRSSIDKSVKPSKRVKLEDEVMQSKCPELADNDGVSARVIIGANGTSISRKDWNSINWGLSAAAITRKILMAVFDRHTLAHNTLSGKPSPAFIGYQKPEKGQLNPQMVEDIMSFMTTHFAIKVRDVKYAITSKCADESKSLRQRLSLDN